MMKTEKKIMHLASLTDDLLRYTIDAYGSYKDGVELYNHWINDSAAAQSSDITCEEAQYLLTQAELFVRGDIEHLRLCRDVQDDLR